MHGGDRPTNSMFEEVDFHWCILVDRMAWDKLKRSKVNDFLRQELEDLPETVTVQCSDLYFEADDVTPLEVARGGAGRASLVVPTDALPPCEGHKEPYPFENPVRPLPERLLWIYRAAFAHRNKSDARPEDFKTWLREHSCVKLVDTRQWRTVRILAPRRSRKDRSFNEDLLGQLPNGRALLAKDMAFLGTAMKCALAAHHWWIEHDAPTRAERTELLGGKLLELGFTGSTAIQDLLQIIADLRVEEGEMGALMAKLETRARLTEAKRSMAADRAGMQKDAHRAAAFEGVPLQVSDDDHTGIQVIEEAVEDSEAALLYPPIRARL
ncbi:MAG: hypothetical protein EOP83_03915 [Verrucomicrobiaceae bacterium]|nr:MAG: hypothetical protein EOP83_03915 [Verrucomicrobiaceae bacterium]